MFSWLLIVMKFMLMGLGYVCMFFLIKDNNFKNIIYLRFFFIFKKGGGGRRGKVFFFIVSILCYFCN